jgi:hypothetical protein
MGQKPRMKKKMFSFSFSKLSKEFPNRFRISLLYF